MARSSARAAAFEPASPATPRPDIRSGEDKPAPECQLKRGSGLQAQMTVTTYATLHTTSTNTRPSSAHLPAGTARSAAIHPKAAPAQLGEQLRSRL
ncbi:MAG: hypothetical protein ACRDZ4_16745 [Egibacteraceae bacterium]